MLDPFKERIEKIEREILKILPDSISPQWILYSAGDPLHSLSLGQIEKIVEPAKTLLARGGKRWRPLLMLLCSELCGGGMRALSLTPLVEIPHDGSLIIDDIEDNSKERRGGLAIHIEYGVDMAVNTGNFMYFLPTKLIDQSPLERDEKLLVYRYFLEDMRRLHLGQGLDILWHRDHRYIPKVEEYMQMCRLKTGSLARMAAQIGVIAGRGDEGLAMDLGEIAEDFGVAFQIIDDIKNLGSGPGKQRGDDIIEGKKSLPIILYLTHNPEEKLRVKKLFESSNVKDPENAAGAIEEIISLLTHSGCLDEAETMALELLQKTKNRLKDHFQPSEPLTLIKGLIDSLINS